MAVLEKSRVYLIDDHPLLRKGLRLLLQTESDLTVCGEASSAEEALLELPNSESDLVIVDISLPGMSGIDFIKRCKRLFPNLRFLVYSRHDETLYAERAIRAGALGYILKSAAPPLVLQAIRRVLCGSVFVSPVVNERLLESITKPHQACHESPLEVLSDRELEVFEMTGKGMGTKAIAGTLILSVKTVESYRARIKAKLHLGNASELMQHAIQWVENERFIN